MNKIEKEYQSPEHVHFGVTLCSFYCSLLLDNSSSKHWPEDRNLYHGTCTKVTCVD